MNDDKTLVIFRRWRDGGTIIALFPEIPSDIHGWFCEAYEHVGQHGGADYHNVIAATKPVEPVDAADLAKELTGIGYKLKPIRRASPQNHEARRAEARLERAFMPAISRQATLQRVGLTTAKKTVVAVFTTGDDDTARYHIGTVAIDHTIDPASIGDTLSDLWQEWREENEEPDSDSAFIDWLIEKPGFSAPAVEVVCAVIGV